MGDVAELVGDDRAQLGPRGAVEQVVVEDDALGRADAVDVGVERGRPGGWRRRGRPRRCRPRPRGRARARRRAPGCPSGSGSNLLKIGARTTGAIQTKTTASPVTTAAPGATSARGKRRTRASSSAAPPAVSTAVIPARAGDVPEPRAQRLGREPDVDRALVRDQAHRQRGDRDQQRDAGAGGGGAEQRPRRRAGRAPGARGAGRPKATATRTAPSTAIPATSSSRWPPR